MKTLLRLKVEVWLQTLVAIVIATLCCPDSMCEGAVKINRDEFDFEDLLNALATVESSNDPNAYNEDEDAVGLYQIRPIYLRDVNKILGYPRYKLSDRRDPKKSSVMVSIYLSYYAKHYNETDILLIGSMHKGIKHYKSKSRAEYKERIARALLALRNENS